MKIKNLLIKKFKNIFNIISTCTRNNDDFNKHHKNANVGELIDLMTVIRYFSIDPFFRIITLFSRMRYESLFLFLFRGKIRGKYIALSTIAHNYRKLFYKKIRKYFCFGTLLFKLNFFKKRQNSKVLSNKFFAVLSIIVFVLFILSIHFQRKDFDNKNYYMQLYEELFSKGFWKSSIFKVFLFKGQNYIEDLMEFEGNTIISFIGVIYRKIAQLYNTFYLIKSANKNKKTKKFLKNIKKK